MPFSPGEIYKADLGDGESHYVIIVSREYYNQGNYVTIVPVTSKNYDRRSTKPNCVPFQAGEFCFGKQCVAQAENITLLKKIYLDSQNGPVGKLDDIKMRSLIHAIGEVIDADCEPCA